MSPLNRRILLLGAAGGIGSAIRLGLAGRYGLMRLADITPLAPARSGEETVHADLLDLPTLVAAMAGIDTVIHMAGVPVEPETNAWDQVLPANIVGVHNLFEAARRAGVKRVLFASSHHAAGFHRRDTPTAETMVPRPDSYYGVSKVFGEAMGRMYADKFGLQVLSLRIGAYRDRPFDIRQLSVWISPRDMVELVRCGIEAADFGYATVYGVSGNTRSFWDNSDVAFLGYAPRDNAEDWAVEVLAGPGEDALAAPFQGGWYCAKGFVGAPERVDDDRQAPAPKVLV
ncbi:NAD(P)-dependent oxidoreductase [Caulobacter sp. UNC279MFTsu5.1]|uniref:NAD-dependent epimerase/dehydratase family protein n=1 Tax=Caulobacter sp. UNC279MFTsu5.1 TaxID=1502775 RepID=UPI0008E5B4D6|nr:NAD(P)-dependent oxidoreductase [Caulobacter sp. UNC279MFTsu5.1]SFJ24036.1 uronate dehydrogenase [Caulobacter sp. UNC279MFTsu5.1]